MTARQAALLHRCYAVCENAGDRLYVDRMLQVGGLRFTSYEPRWVYAISGSEIQPLVDRLQAAGVTVRTVRRPRGDGSFRIVKSE